MMNALEKLGYKINERKSVGSLTVYERQFDKYVPAKMSETEAISINADGKRAIKQLVCKDGSLLPMYFNFDELLALAEVIKEEEKK